jgi:hypothetical protein
MQDPIRDTRDTPAQGESGRDANRVTRKLTGRQTFRHPAAAGSRNDRLTSSFGLALVLLFDHA